MKQGRKVVLAVLFGVAGVLGIAGMGHHIAIPLTHTHSHVLAGEADPQPPK